MTKKVLFIFFFYTFVVLEASSSNYQYLIKPLRLGEDFYNGWKVTEIDKTDESKRISIFIKKNEQVIILYLYKWDENTKCYDRSKNFNISYYSATENVLTEEEKEFAIKHIINLIKKNDKFPVDFLVKPKEMNEINLSPSKVYITSTRVKFIYLKLIFFIFIFISMFVAFMFYKKRINFFLNVIISLSTILLLFVLGELIISIINIYQPTKYILEPMQNVENKMISTNSKSNEVYNIFKGDYYEFKPFINIKKEEGKAVFGEFNSWGTRGKELNSQAQFRIVGLGDSVTFGVYLDDKDTFLRILEDKLTSYYKSNEIEVINLAVPGYNITTERISLERKGIKLKPNIIILNFNISDPYQIKIINNIVYPLTIVKAKNVDDSRQMGRTFKIHKLLNEISCFYFFINTKINSLLYKYDMSRQANRFNLVFYEVSEINRIAKSIGSKFLIVLHPETIRNFSEQKETEYLFNKVEKYAQIRGVNVVNLLKIYRERNIDLKKIKLDDALHLNKHGNKLVADILYEHLIKLDLLPNGLK